MTNTHVTLTVAARDADEAQTVANALAAVVSTLVRNGARDVSLRVTTWDDEEEELETEETAEETGEELPFQ